MRVKAKIDICRRCPKFSIEAEGRERSGEIYLYKLLCTGSTWRHPEIAYEWKEPHRFDLNAHFIIPFDCAYKLEHVMSKGRRSDNGNSFEANKDGHADLR